MSPQLRLFPCLLAVAVVVALPTVTTPKPADPFADPAHDPYNPLKYIPNDVLSGVSTGLVILVALTQVWLTVKYHAKWLLVMTLGCFTFAFGLATRFAFARNPDRKAIYIVEYLFIVLSPCAFIAGSYVTLGRLARYLKADAFLLIRPTRVTLVFIMSDVITFLIQAIGGSMAVASNDIDKIKLGGTIFKVGIILQLVSFAFFILLLMVFNLRLYTKGRAIWTANKGTGLRDWRWVLVVLYVSCVTIMIRSAYRVAESVEGLRGRLSTTEWLFYTFDTLPLFICIATYTVFWPGRYMRPSGLVLAEQKAMPLEGFEQHDGSQSSRVAHV